jgi:hypothetical protein
MSLLPEQSFPRQAPAVIKGLHRSSVAIRDDRLTSKPVKLIEF